MLCRAKLFEWNYLQDLLTVYKKALGMFLNRQKISLFFSYNTNRGAKEEILAIAGIYSYNNQAKYLGLPSTVGKSKY